MSSTKVKTFDRQITVTGDVVTGTGPYTHTLTTPTHYLKTGDVVKITDPGTGEFNSVAVTVISGTSFSVSLPTNSSVIGDQVIAQFYSAGMTGGQPSVTWPQQSTPGVIQVVSTGAATIVVEGSLNNTDWVAINTFTHPGAQTTAYILNAAWAYVRANITSIAALQTATIYRSV